MKKRAANAPVSTSGDHASSSPSGLTAPQVLDALSTIGCVLLAIATIGFAAFRFLPTLPPGASRNPDRTFFMTVNALTQTGFAQANAAVPDFPLYGQLTLCLLALSGAVICVVAGGWLLLCALGSSIRLSRLIFASLALIALPAVLAGPIVGWTDALLNACGVGLTTHRSSTLMETLSRHLVSLPGALGLLAILMMSGTRLFRDRRGYIVGAVAAFVVLYLVGILATYLAGESTLVAASIASMDYRGLGLPGPRVDGNVSSWVAILLMVPGGGPASTGGGLGTLPPVIAAVGIVDLLRGHTADRWLGVALVWVCAFFGFLIALVLSLAALEPALGGERLLLLAVSAITNNGLSVNPVGLTGGGLFVLSFGMIVGCLLPLAMLGWLAVTAVPVDRRDAVAA